MINRNQARKPLVGRLALAAAVLAFAGFATAAHAVDNGVSANNGELRINGGPGAGWFEYSLSYQVEGSLTHAHIHLGERGAPSMYSVWLCGTSTSAGPVGTPTCPSASNGAVTGTIAAANVVGPKGQGVNPAEFEQFLKAIQEGKTYANVHTTRHPSGQIRGQIN